jgi:hypothetical protein
MVEEIYLSNFFPTTREVDINELDFMQFLEKKKK